MDWKNRPASRNVIDLRGEDTDARHWYLVDTLGEQLTDNPSFMRWAKLERDRQMSMGGGGIPEWMNRLRTALVEMGAEDGVADTLANEMATRWHWQERERRMQHERITKADLSQDELDWLTPRPKVR